MSFWDTHYEDRDEFVRDLEVDEVRELFEPPIDPEPLTTFLRFTEGAYEQAGDTLGRMSEDVKDA